MEELLPKDNENIPQFDPGPLAPSAPQGFTPDQMVKCQKCGRANPPTRAQCLYCAAPFPFDERGAELRKPALRPLEAGESGYSNISVRSQYLTPQAYAEAAALLKLSDEQISKIVTATVPLPLARTGSLDEAKLIEARLRQLGISSFIVADADLKLEEQPAVRVRAAEFGELALTLHQVTTNDRWEVAWPNLMMLVHARLTIKSFVSKEQKASGTDNKILDASETQTDEAVLDLYTNDRESAFRITANSFDFSCLGVQKGLLANENFKQLIQSFLQRSPAAVLDESYKSVRNVLELTWPAQQRTESRGWRRERLGKITFGAVTEVSNEQQFSRYSRLRHYLHQRSEI